MIWVDHLTWRFLFSFSESEGEEEFHVLTSRVVNSGSKWAWALGFLVHFCRWGRSSIADLISTKDIYSSSRKDGRMEWQQAYRPFPCKYDIDSSLLLNFTFELVNIQTILKIRMSSWIQIKDIIWFFLKCSNISHHLLDQFILFSLDYY